jgi:hypothetical protein
MKHCIAAAVFVICTGLFLSLTTQPVIATPGYSRTDPMGGTGGGPIDGSLLITVVEAGTSEPVSGAFVMAGPAPGTPFSGNFGVTDGAGQIQFTDPALSGPVSITAGTAGTHLFTFFSVDAMDVVIPLQMDSQPPQTFQIGDDVAGIDVDNGILHAGDGYLDFAVVITTMTLDILSTMDLDGLSIEMEPFSVLGQEILLPSNVYIPQQWELFTEITKDHYYLYLPEGTHMIFAVSCRVALDDILALAQGSGDFLELIPAIQWREIDVIEIDVQANTDDADLNLTSDLESTVTIDYGSIPDDSALFVLSAGDLDNMNGLGNLVMMDISAAGCEAGMGPCSGELPLNAAAQEGDFSNTGYFPVAVVMSNKSNDLLALLDRTAYPQTYTADMDSFFNYVDPAYNGSTFAWNDVQNHTSGSPAVAVSAGTITDTASDTVVWTYLTAGTQLNAVFPELPPEAPIAPVPGHVYDWSHTASGLESAAFDFNEFAISEITEGLSHLALDSRTVAWGSECAETGCRVFMPSHEFQPLDLCYCDVTVCNLSPNILAETPVFVILDIFGSYFFAPSFTDFDYYEMDIQPGETVIEVLPEFVWPSGAGTLSGAMWYAAMTDPGITELVGELGIFTFGWSE